MNDLILTSKDVPRTYPPIMLDNLQLCLPIIVNSDIDRYISIPLPENLRNVCEGRSIYIRSSGVINIGKYSINTNGTKLLCGEIKKPYKLRAKNQNFLNNEDVPLIKELLHLKSADLLPQDLYRHQLKIFLKKLDVVKQLLCEHGFNTEWKSSTWTGGNKIKRLEICQDFVAPVDPKELIQSIGSVVSELNCSEPIRSGEERSRIRSRQAPYHYWRVKPSQQTLKGGSYTLKLYQKDRYIRLELACLDMPVSGMPVGLEPFSWLGIQLEQIAIAAASYLDSITTKLLEFEPKINDMDRNLLIEGLRLYSPSLKYSDEAVRILVDSLMDRQVYVPSAHRGNSIGRKSLANLGHISHGICSKKVNPSDNSNSFILRADWKEQLERKKQIKVSATEGSVTTSNLQEKKSDNQISRRDFILGNPIISFLKKFS